MLFIFNALYHFIVKNVGNTYIYYFTLDFDLNSNMSQKIWEIVMYIA